MTAGPGQAGHALPPPPMGMVGMQMGGAMQPPPAKKPAVPDWVRQELLKRGLHSDAAGGRCSISLFCPAVPSIAGHLDKVSLAQEAHVCMLGVVLDLFSSVCQVVANARSAGTCIGNALYLPITTNPSICVSSTSSQRQA